MNTYHTLAIMINDLCSMMTSSIEIPPSSTSDAAIPDKSIQADTADGVYNYKSRYPHRNKKAKARRSPLGIDRHL